MSLPANIFQIGVSAVLLTFITLPPGLLALRAMGFNPRQALLIPPAIILGMLLVPLALNTAGQVTRLTVEARLLIIATLNGALLLIPARPDISVPSLAQKTKRHLLLLSGITVIWVLLPLAGHGTPRGDEWVRTNVTDWAKHSSVVTSLTLSDRLPPPNYFLSTEPTLKYYYFAFILPGMVNRLDFLTSANSFIGLVLLNAACLPFLIALWGRAAGLSEAGTVWSATTLWFVGGLDIIFSLLAIIFAGMGPDGVDFWVKLNHRPIATVSRTFVWHPQHALAALGALCILWLMQYPLNRRQIVGIAVILAAIAGTSVQIWMAACVLLSSFALVELVRRNLRALGQLAAVLALSQVISLPFVLSITDHSANSALVISISSMGGLGPFKALLGKSQIANLLDFPIQIVIEFGALLGMGLVVLARFWRTEAQCWLAGLAALFVMLLMLRTSVETNNLSQHLGTLIWFMLAFLGGWWWSLEQKRWSLLLRAAVILGVLTVIYDEAALSAPSSRISDDEMQLYHWLNHNLTPEERYQPGLEPDSNAAYFVKRWVALSNDGLDVATLYARRDNRYAFVYDTLQQAYTTSDPVLAAAGFHTLGVDVVVSSPDEPLVSENAAAFAQAFTLIYHNQTYAVYRVNYTNSE